MGWDVELRVKDEEGKWHIAETKPHYAGSIIEFGGSHHCEMTVTFNYSRFYSQVFPEKGFRWLNDRKASDAIPVLEDGIKALGTRTTGSYWDESPGNAGYILTVLLEWAKEHPDGVFKVI